MSDLAYCNCGIFLADCAPCLAGKVLELEAEIEELKAALKTEMRFKHEAFDQRDKSDRLNGEMLALIRKIDAFFEDPRILTGPHAVILDIPYEIAAGVKAVLTTPLRPVCEHDWMDGGDDGVTGAVDICKKCGISFHQVHTEKR